MKWKFFTCCNLFGDELHGEDDDEHELIDNEFEFDESVVLVVMIWCDDDDDDDGGGGGGGCGGGGGNGILICDS